MHLTIIELKSLFHDIGILDSVSLVIFRALHVFNDEEEDDNDDDDDDI